MFCFWKEKEPESLRFVRNLCEKNPPPVEQEDWFAGYRYEMTLCFDEVSITLKHNTIRQQWDMEIWSIETGFLFYYDSLSPKPMRAINYLIERFGVRGKMQALVEQKMLEKKQKDNAADALKAKYLED